MTSTAPIPHEVPTARSCPFDPAQEITALRNERPVSRMTYHDDHEGWLATSYAAVRAVLGDPRFSHRRELLRTPCPIPVSGTEGEPSPPGAFAQTDPPEHTRYRKLLTGQFTVRRMNALAPRIEQITNDRLDAMERAGAPVDLVQSFALPIPSLVICELLGVPYDDRDRFQRDSAVFVNLASTTEQVGAAIASMREFVLELVARKRVEPADDLLSGLLAGTGLTDDEVAMMGLVLLGAGHETTANMLALGVFALLQHPDQMALLRADPEQVANAVEELLRYLTVLQIGPIRTALEDVEVEGQLIKSGDSVTLSVVAANRDPKRFPEPDQLDITRQANGHLAFGHGVHQCIGQQLARAEMRIAYPALLRRFPDLHLAIPAEEVPLRTDMIIYGVHRLPVAW